MKPPVTSLVLGGEYRTHAGRIVKVIRDYGEDAGAKRFLVESVGAYVRDVYAYFYDSNAKGPYILYPAPSPTKTAYWAVSAIGADTFSSGLHAAPESANADARRAGQLLLASGAVEVPAGLKLYGED